MITILPHVYFVLLTPRNIYKNMCTLIYCCHRGVSPDKDLSYTGQWRETLILYELAPCNFPQWYLLFTRSFFYVREGAVFLTQPL